MAQFLQIIPYPLQGGAIRLWLLFTAWLVFVANAHASSLAELDRILTESSGLTDFLSEERGELRERYRQALSDFYGPDAIPGDVFDQMIVKLRKLDAQIPGFGARLWETTGLGERFSVSVRTPSYARNVDTLLWDDYLAKWTYRLAAKTDDYYVLEPEARIAKLKSVAQSISAELLSHQKKLSHPNLSRHDRDEADRQFYQELKTSPAFISASAFILHRYMASENIRDQLRANDADLIFKLLKELDENPAATAADLGPDFPRQWLSLLKPQILKIGDLLAREDLFPPMMRETRRKTLVRESKTGIVDYDFIPFPRRFHGIWKGFPIGECVSGLCARFATVALEQTQLYSVENKGNPHGFIQLVPGKIGKKTYGSIDFGSPILGRKLVSDGPVPDLHANLYEKVIGELGKRLPPDWSGIVVGKDHAINNAGIIPLVHSSLQYLEGKQIAQGKDFRILDPIARYVAKMEAPGQYGSGMIIDATVRGNDSQPLVKLSLDSVGSQGTAPISRSIAIPDWPVKDVLAQALNYPSLIYYLELTRSWPRERRIGLLAETSLIRLESYSQQTKFSGDPAGKRDAETGITEGLVRHYLNQLEERPNFLALGHHKLKPFYPTLLGSLGMRLPDIFSGATWMHIPGFQYTWLGLTAVGAGGLAYTINRMFHAFERYRYGAEIDRQKLKQSLEHAVSENIPVPAPLLRKIADTRAARSCHDLAKALLNP